MYNDEQNLYHYTYRKDGTEPGQRYDAKQPTVDEQLNSYRQQQEQQTQNSQPVYQSQPQGGQTPHKNGKNRLGLKIASLALVCALLGGLVGGGTAYLVGNHSGSDTTEVNVSNRKPTDPAENRGRQESHDGRGAVRNQRQQRGVHQHHRYL